MALIDSAVTYMRQQDGRERGSDMQHRVPRPLQRGQSLCTWDACSTNLVVLPIQYS